MYFVYVVRNKITRELYIGYTEDLKRRFKEHKDKNPELIYCEVYKSKKDATQREKQLKRRGQSIRWLKNRIKHSLIE